MLKRVLLLPVRPAQHICHCACPRTLGDGSGYDGEHDADNNADADGEHDADNNADADGDDFFLAQDNWVLVIGAFFINFAMQVYQGLWAVPYLGT